VRLYSGYFEVAIAWFTRAMSFVVPALFLWAIVLAFRQSRGESRVRLTWILATLGTMMCVELAVNARVRDRRRNPARHLPARALLRERFPAQHVEKLVDRVFFSAWAAKDAELARFTKEASHATDPGALGKLLVAAVDRFTDGAGCAVYRPGNSFTRSDTTLPSAPEHVDANDETALALRAHGKAVRIRDTSTLNATLALPMTHRGELNGFVLVGLQRSGDAYRPDQIEALESAVRNVGLDFYALKIEALQNELAVEQRAAETLRAQLQTAYELQKTSPGNAPA